VRAKTKTVLTTAAVGIAWVVAVAFGLRVLLNYESAPGRVGAVPQSWPATSQIPRANDRPTLIMMAHPRCPCTRASMNELAQVMARVQGKITAYVLFYKPRGPSRPGGGDDWEHTDLRQSAAQIPGVIVLSDVDGVEARRFGAETSGHTFLFDSAGRLLFNGGITESRGHSGDNAGESAIVSLVKDRATKRAETFVFGCSLSAHAQSGTGLPCLK